jgi:hypothetical protein
VENSFSNEIQGMCHDESSWFITHNDPPLLLKIPLSSDLRTAEPIAAAFIPIFLRQKGYDHMGDPDCINGLVFVPLEASHHFDTTQGAVAVFNASDLSFVNWAVQKGERSARTEQNSTATRRQRSVAGLGATGCGG